MQRLLRAGFVLPGLLAAGYCFGDPRVVVSAVADPEYTEHKYGGGKTAAESYVVMQGRYFDGGIVDHSIERMPFRKIAEIFAPELAKQQYLPVKDARDADLLIVVHWGTTRPKLSTMEMTARTSPLPDFTAARADKQVRMESAAAGGGFVSGMAAELAHEDTQLLQMERLDQLSDQISGDYASARAAQLLGYARDLRQYGDRVAPPAEEYALRLDLTQMRYFIILRAYNLRAPTVGGRSRAVWTLHLNVSSSGNSFSTAVDHMSVAAVSYVGRSTERVETVLPSVPEGKVEIGPLLILGEAR